jgi:hypothetical protein
MLELAKWNTFYAIVGSAAGALIGLQFVVITLIAERPTAGAAEAGAAFATPTVAHFAAALFLSLLLHAPWGTITSPAILWGILGFGGVAFSLIVGWRMKKQPVYKPVFEDWLFYVGMPLVAYAALAASSFAAIAQTRKALFGVGAAALLLLFTGIHNSWDSISYHVLVSRPKAIAEKRDRSKPQVK